MDKAQQGRMAFVIVAVISGLLLVLVIAVAIGAIFVQRTAELSPRAAGGSNLVAVANASEDAEDVGEVAQPAEQQSKENTDQEQEVDKQVVDMNEMKDKLTEEQFAVCFNAATEPPFSGKYWDHHEPGVYTCVACAAPLFSSNAKFDSGTGWPSYYEAVEEGNIELKEDSSHGMRRTEVLCGNCNAHLGHLFDDGPEPTGLRYCINSASLEFVADDETETE